MSRDRKQMPQLPPCFLKRLQQGYLSHSIPATVEQHDLAAACTAFGGHGLSQPPAALSVQILRLSQEAGLRQPGQAVLDGGKIGASPSNHKAMSHGRMQKTREELEKEIAAPPEKTEAVDQQEVEAYGKFNKGWDLPKELQRLEARLEIDKQALNALGEEAAKPADPELQGQKGATPLGAIRPKLATNARQTISAKRRATVDPVFGQIKDVREPRQFLSTDKESVRLSGRFGALHIIAPSPNGMEAPPDLQEGAFFGFTDEGIRWEAPNRYHCCSSGPRLCGYATSITPGGLLARQRDFPAPSPPVG